MKKRIFYKTISYVACVLILTYMNGCKKFVQIPGPKNSIVTNQVFADSADATQAILGMYINDSNVVSGSGGISGGILTVCTGLSADELSSATGSISDIEFYSDKISSADNENITILWNQDYKNIYFANASIEGLQQSRSLSSSLKSQLLGEAELYRGMIYFNMVNLFGGVPLAKTTNYKVNEVLPRSPVDSIYKQILADATDAQSLLGVNYVTSGRLRPNKYTATAFLAKVYLYQKQWANAEAAASSIINSGEYALEADLNNVFLAGSNEAIWQFQPVIQGYETNDGVLLVPGSNDITPSYGINNYLLSAFEAGDQRKVKWLNYNVVNGTNNYYPYKYKLGYDGNSSPVEDNMVFRLGEQYLIRAEARAEQSGEQTGAISDLNIIRTRAGLPNYTGATDQASLLNVIYHERQVELFCEQGNRWFDLKRTGTINTVLGVPGNEKQGWQPFAELYPIPNSELQGNPFLIQNPGY